MLTVCHAPGLSAPGAACHACNNSWLWSDVRVHGRAEHVARRHAAFAQLAPVCEQLAAEQQRTAALRADLLTERERKGRLDGAAARASGHIAALRESLEAGGGEAAMARVRAQVAQLRERVHEVLPKCALRAPASALACRI